MTFTGCGFGKDDFYGTWKTLDFDAEGNEITSYRTDNGWDRTVTWCFDGTSENMFGGDGGGFWQHLVAKNSNGDVVAETFWYGEYDIKGNSGYSKGKLYLYYECGYDIKNGDVDLETLKTWKVEDFVEKAGLSGLDSEALTAIDTVRSDGTSYYMNNHVFIQLREKDGKKQCGDIEYFRFVLKAGPGDIGGYNRMRATVLNKAGSTPARIGGVYNQWTTANTEGFSGTFRGGYKTSDQCTWSGVDERFMGLIDGNGTFKTSSKKTNEELFPATEDSTDQTNYSDPEGKIEE